MHTIYIQHSLLVPQAFATILTWTARDGKYRVAEQSLLNNLVINTLNSNTPETRNNSKVPIYKPYKIPHRPSVVIVSKAKHPQNDTPIASPPSKTRVFHSDYHSCGNHARSQNIADQKNSKPSKAPVGHGADSVKPHKPVSIDQAAQTVAAIVHIVPKHKNPDDVNHRRCMADDTVTPNETVAKGGTCKRKQWGLMCESNAQRDMYAHIVQKAWL